jgi:hypothetical protein
VQALRQAQYKHFGKLSASTSASSVQALRQAQCKSIQYNEEMRYVYMLLCDRKTYYDVGLTDDVVRKLV